MKKYYIFICLLFGFFPKNEAQVSMNMTLLDNWDPSGQSYNDVWGYVDGSGNEYAIVGSYDKIHFLEITSSNTLSLVDEFDPNGNSVWRDFKTYGNYAYAVSEGGNTGLLVYDLSNLPASVSFSNQTISHFTRAHNIYIDEPNGKLYACGTNTQGNGLIVYDVTTNPPTHLASVPLPGGGYVHDLYVRGDTAYCSHGNNGFYIWDMSTPTSPNFLASYTGESGYNHSSWVTPDGNTAFYAREVGVGLPMTALDISNYNNISVTSNWKFPLLAPGSVNNVPHNPYLLGDYLFTSYYEDGIQVFDVSDPANVTVAAYYDTYPSNTQYNGYEGCWGAYPYLPSGKVLASDGTNGLFLLDVNLNPLALQLIIQNNVSCNGGNDGDVTVLGTGGTPPYTYSLDGGTPQSSGFFDNLFAGNYQIDINDNGGNSISTTITITEPNPLVPFVSSQQNISCAGDDDGIAFVGAIGGTVTTGYLFSLDGTNYSSNNVFTNLSGGNYLLWVRDNNNCESNTSFTITEPLPLQSLVNNLTPVDCFGNNTGAAVFSTVGGTPGFTYTIDQVNFQLSSSFPDLFAGNYTLTTIDGNGCQAQTPFTITEPLVLGISVLQQTDLNCFGDNDGEVILDGSGGTGVYQYNVNGGNYQTSATFSNLSAGSYDFNIKDLNDCIESINVIITSPTEIVAQLSAITNVDCFGENTGSVTVSLSGGAGNYSTNLNGLVQNGNIVTFNNLAAGAYQFFIQDGNNCSTFSDFNITQNSEIQLFASNTQDVTCFQGQDGLIQLLALGGNGGYTYFLDGISNGNNNTFTNLSAGQYDVMVMDNLNCQEVISVTINEPTEVIANVIALNDVSCAGQNDGSVTLDATGGAGNYQFFLNGTSNTSGIFQNLSAGSYQANVLDQNNCLETVSFVIGQSSSISGQILNQTNVICFGENNGSVEVQATGGTGNLTFTLGNQTNSNGIFQNLAAGNYSVQIADQNNCQNSINVDISQPAEIISNITNQQNVICFGENNGSVEVQATGGNGNLTFTLGNQTNSNGIFQNLTAGNYSVQVTDQNNCQNSINVDISQPAEIISNIANQQNVICFGENNGSVEVQATGGNGNLTFTLGNQTNSNGIFQNLAAGNYSVQVTDQNNCQNSINVDISQPAEINSNIANQQNVICFGENNGSVEVQSSGGNGNLTFTLGNQTNSNGIFQNLTAGNYSVQIMDQNNCQNSIIVDISEPTILSVQTDNVQLASCSGQQGSIQVSASGGTLPYTFSNGSETNSTGFFENLSAGIYMITATDGNNCSSSIDVDIIEPNALNVEILSTQNIICNGENSGNFQLNAMGGTGTITYTLGNETNSTGFFENLMAGTFSVSVEDANNCSSLVEVEIDEPALLELSINQITEVNCYGETSGSINLEAIGGIGTLNFTLGNENNTTGFFENLVADNYQVMVSDANNCNTSIEFIINEPADLEANILQNNPANCSGENSGMVQIEALGGVGNYQFNMAGETNSTGLFENLYADDYMLNLTDGNGCSESMLISVVEPLAINIDDLNVQDVLCFGENTGAIQISGSGGVGTLDFTLGNETNSTGLFSELSAGSYSIEITDENGCQNTLQATVEESAEITAEVVQTQNVLCNGETSGEVQLSASGGSGMLQFILGNEENSTGEFENLSAGNYEVMVMDIANCVAILQFEITEPVPFELTVAQIQNVNCNGENSGVINLNASGGTGAFEFSLGNQTNTTGVFENLPEGMYQIVATDNNMCTSSVEVEITQPDLIEINVAQMQNVNCAGENSGAITFVATGGNGAFTFSSNNESNSDGVFENLVAGVYNIEVTDENNCSEVSEFTITEPQPIEVTFDQTQSISCAGEDSAVIEMNASGGTGDIEFSLGNQTNTTGIFENLSAGSYSVISTDQNGCSTSITIEIDEPQPLATGISQTQNVLCFDSNEGAIQATATGGTGTYFFTLNGNTNSTGFFENLPAGNYIVQILDENDCEDFQEITLAQPADLNLVLENVQPAECNGAATGSIQMLASGGTGDLAYSVDNQTNMTGLFENLTSGVYDVSVEDDNGCLEILQVTVNENNDISVDEITLINVDCFGNENGMIQLNATGGTGDLSYTLDSETNSTGSFENLPAGSYNIIISDAANCNSFFPFEIMEPAALLVFADEINPVSCFGTPTGSVHLMGSGGAGNYSFSLDGNTSPDGWFYDLPAGSHIAMILDENDCSGTVIFDIPEPAELTVNLINLTNDSGSGDGSITIEGIGGTPGYTYSLDGINFQDENIFENLAEGNYTGYVQDLNGCITEFNFDILLETSISNPELGILEMNILPNPFSENITVQVDLAFAQNIHLKITSIAGQEIFQKSNHLTQGKQNILLNVESNVPAGVYILSVKNDKEVIGHFKLIKQ